MIRLDLGLSGIQLEQLCAAMDTNGDGVVSYSEFVQSLHEGVADASDEAARPSAPRLHVIHQYSDVVKEAEAAIVAAEKTARSEVAAASQHEIAEREKLASWKHKQRTERFRARQRRSSGSGSSSRKWQWQRQW